MLKKKLEILLEHTNNDVVSFCSTLKNKKELRQEMDAQFPDIKMGEQAYLIMNNLQKPHCHHGNFYSFDSLKNGYKSGCSKNCPCVLEKMSERVKAGQSNMSDDAKEQMLLKKSSSHKKMNERKKLKALENIRDITDDEFQKELSEATILLGKYKFRNGKDIFYKFPSLFAELEKRYGKRSLNELLYLENFGLNVKTCQYGSEKKFLSFPLGYGFCGLPSKCKCHMEHKIETQTKVESERSIENRRDITEKRKNTVLQIYGVDNAMKSPVIQTKLRQYYLDNHGIYNATQLHYNIDHVWLLNDDTALIDHIEKYNIYKVAEMIGMTTNNLYKICKKKNIDIIDKCRSSFEKDIFNVLKNNNISFKHGLRSLTSNGKEIDFYVENHNVGIEFNGLFWHSEVGGKKDSRYHYNKWKDLADKNINLLTIYEDEYINNREFWINKILQSCKASVNKSVYARNCSVSVIDNKIGVDFLKKYHIQGKTPSSIYYGLYHNEELLAVMSFGEPSNKNPNVIKNNREIEMKRLCFKAGYNIVGGAGKLLKFAISTLKDYDHIVTFSNNRYSSGDIYQTLGFEHISDSPPSYDYTFYQKRFNKNSFDKAGIIAKFDLPEDYMDNRKEWEVMQEFGYDRIWDCGKKKWILEIK